MYSIVGSYSLDTPRRLTADDAIPLMAAALCRTQVRGVVI